MKQCRTCCEVKPLAMYSKKPDSRDGLQPVCKPCAAAYRKQWAASKPGYVDEYNKRYIVENRGKIAAQRLAKKLANPAAYVEVARKRYARNAAANRARRSTYYKANRERCVEVVKDWRKTHGKDWRKKNYALYGHRYAATAATRRLQESRATPTWVDRKAIEDFYETAAGLSMYTGEWYHVDHIVPLRGKTVCGLHTQANLQVLPAKENMLKSNRHWPDQPQ